LPDAGQQKAGQVNRVGVDTELPSSTFEDDAHIGIHEVNIMDLGEQVGVLGRLVVAGLATVDDESHVRMVVDI